MNYQTRTTIGEYEAALREINNPISEDYRPIPDGSFSCEQLLEGINYLTGRIQLWTTRLNSLRYGLFSGDRTTANNISQILNVLNQRLQLYQQAHQIKCLSMQSTPVVTDPTLETVSLETPTATQTGSVLLPLLLVAGGIFLITRKKRRGSRRRKR